jgi:AcrR family transcriptional regulator
LYGTLYEHVPALSTANRVRADTRARLTRQEIAGAALDLVDEHGLEALTMRRLAESIGVGTMTLYGYVRDKDELLDAIVDAATSRDPVRPVEGPWEERLRALARQAYAGLVRHPALVELRLRRPILTPRAFRVTELAFEALLEAGFPHSEAARAFRVLFLYVFGSAAFNQPELSAPVRAATRGAIASLPEDEFPLLSRSADEVAVTTGGAEQFEYGLELVIAGIEARLAGAR